MNKPQRYSFPVFLALGTNLGDRMANLDAALEQLARLFTITARSPVYVTPPWGYTDQPAFLNMVIAGQVIGHPTPGGARSLLAALKRIEVDLGRQPSFRNGPRLIDLDILFYDDLVIDLPGLSVPHPRLSQRQFVLVPLADIAPDLVHPITHLTVAQMLERLDEPVTAYRYDQIPPEV